MLNSLTLRSLVALLAVSAALCAGCHAATRSPIPPATTDAQLARCRARRRQSSPVAASGHAVSLERVKGVLDTTVGYSGGSASTATYEQVGTETTGHAESVKVVYDPSKITYGQLLRIFFSVAHDPTELNRQGPDTGTSYRSVIFYGSDEQKNIAQAYIAQLDAAHIFPRRSSPSHAAQGVLQRRGLSPALRRQQPDNPYILVCDRPRSPRSRSSSRAVQDYKGR